MSVFSLSDSIVIVCSEGAEFKVSHAEACLMQTVAAEIESLPPQPEHVIHIRTVGSATMHRIVEYCRYHTTQRQHLTESQRKDWEMAFLDIDHPTLFQLVSGANVVSCQPLVELSCKCVTDQIRGKSAEQIRKHFNIKNTMTPEEEEIIRRENQ
eukprot:c12412_g1_i2.p1 GENE.c12412_g1_i2~~c12412_g1_i2.p1  ORF type:complete len:154 (+),score=37.52 c12412_g1_i2:120-581(+)